MDDAIQKKSIEKLDGINGTEYIFTAHYGFIDKREITKRGDTYEN